MNAPHEGIVIDEVTVAFDEALVLDQVSLDVEPGGHIALLGPSGCGKTTLLRSIAGLQRIDAGCIDIGGRCVDDGDLFVEPERRNVGLVFQNGALFSHMTVEKNVLFGVRKRADARSHAYEALEMVGLSDFADRMPDTLSGGQRQRVALARAIAPRPEVLLLDEPFASLDAALREDLRTEVARLLRELGITSVLVTHDQDEAFVAGERVAIMSGGVIQQIGPPAEVYNVPENRFVATFLGNANLVPGTANGPTADTAIGMLPLHSPQRGDVDVVVRPEQLHLSAGGDAVVTSIEFFGHDTLYRVELHGRDYAVRETAAPRFTPGAALSISHRGEPSVAFTQAPSADIEAPHAQPLTHFEGIAS